MLCVMARTLNSKPLTCYRLKGSNNLPREIALISPHSLMFHSNATQIDLMLSLPSFKKRGDERYVLLHKTLRRNVRKLYENFYSHYLSNHYELEGRSSSALKEARIGNLVIFHPRKYESINSNLFYIARIEKLVFYRNSEEIRSFLIVYYDKTKLIRRSVYASDCIHLITHDSIGQITDHDLKTLQY